MKCPKCKAEVDKVYIEQKFSTTSRGEMDENGKKTFEDLEAGWTLLGDWLNNMLGEDGDPEILGCDNCIEEADESWIDYS